MEYLNKITQLFSVFRKANAPSIRIGRSMFILRNSRKIICRPNGSHTRVESYCGPAWKKCRKEITINPSREPNPHIVIVGMSGYGKSTLFKSMLIDIERMGTPAIIFDAHNEHERLVTALRGKVYDSSRSGINILELNGLSKQERIAEIVSLFKRVYSLGHIQATKLGQCLHYTYRKGEVRGSGPAKPPTMADLVAELVIFINNARTASEKNTLLHLKEKVSLLSTGAFMRDPVPMDSLSSGISSFSLAGLKSPEARIIYIHELLRRIYLSMKENGKEQGLRLFIMIDEAQFLLNSQRGSSVITSMVEEGRKYGAGVIIATHLTSNLDRQILANASTLISFYSRDPAEVNYIANAMSGNESEGRDLIRSKIRTLKQNEVIAVSGTMKNAMIVETSDAQQVKRIIDGAAVPAGSGSGRAEAFKMLEPTEYEEARREIGDETIEGLVEQGVVEKMEDNGKAWVMKKNPSKSLEHELNVRKISDKLSGLGIRHYIVNNSSGPDIVAHINGKKTAIEYETGRKSAASTARMLASRAEEFGATIVFVNDNAAAFYKSYFSNENVKVLSISELPGDFLGS
jgi:hypothetical protein